MQQNFLVDEAQWQRANQALRLSLPRGPAGLPWRYFALELYRRVEDWDERERRNYRHRVWDFCVIHSKHESDKELAANLKRLLETSLGFTGRTLAEVELGENTLQAASAMVEGSTKVFILATKYLNRIGVPKFVFQAALMQEILQEKWQRKIVPVRPPGPMVPLPFGLAPIEGLTLGNEPKTVEVVSDALTVEEQMEVRAARRRDEEVHRMRLLHQRESRLQEIREVVAGLRRDFGDDHDPTDQLEQMIDQLRRITGDQGNADQVINVSSCSNISVGPSFHFTVNRPCTSSSSTFFGSPSTSDTSLLDIAPTRSTSLS